MGEENAVADLEAAWEEVEGVENDEAGESGEARESETAGVGAGDQIGEPLEESGDAGEIGGDDSPGAGDEPPGAGSPDTPGAGEGEAAQGLTGEAPAGDDTPPVSLPPAAREVWKDTPKVMQDAIALREKQFADGIQKYAQDAKRASQMDQVLRPYEQYFAVNGGAGPALNTLLQTGAGLQMGSPTQKAELVANIISQYGVDIQALDDILVGQTPQENPNSGVQQQVEQALQPFQQFMNTYQQQQQQAENASQTAVRSEIDQFASNNEFYKDVRGEMADLLQMAANRGQELSLKDAYQKACTLHPEISKILENRRLANDVAARNRAASSVRGNPAGDSPASAGSMRGAILDAWDQQGNV